MKRSSLGRTRTAISDVRATPSTSQDGRFKELANCDLAKSKTLEVSPSSHQPPMDSFPSFTDSVTINPEMTKSVHTSPPKQKTHFKLAKALQLWDKVPEHSHTIDVVMKKSQF